MKEFKQITLKILVEVGNASCFMWQSIMKICSKKLLSKSYYRDFIFTKR